MAFFFKIKFIHLFIHFATQYQSFLSSSSPSHKYSHIPFRRGSPALCVNPTLHHFTSHRVAAGLGTSSPAEARPGCLFRGAGSTGRHIGSRLRDSPYSSCWGTHMKTKLLICYICAGGLGPACVRSFVGDSVSKGPG